MEFDHDSFYDTFFEDSVSTCSASDFSYSVFGSERLVNCHASSSWNDDDDNAEEEQEEPEDEDDDGEDTGDGTYTPRNSVALCVDRVLRVCRHVPVKPIVFRTLFIPQHLRSPRPLREAVTKMCNKLFKVSTKASEASRMRKYAKSFVWYALTMMDGHDVAAGLADIITDLWKSHTQRNEFRLFSTPSAAMACQSLSYLLQSCVFMREFHKRFTRIRNFNSRSPRNIFLVTRFDHYFLWIVQRRPAYTVEPFKVLFKICWDDFDHSTFRIEKTHSDIPAILSNFECLSGLTGQDIYAAAFKYHNSNDFF